MRKVDRVKLVVSLALFFAVVLHLFHTDDWYFAQAPATHPMHQLHRGGLSPYQSDGAEAERESVAPPSPSHKVIRVGASASPPSPPPSDQCYTRPHTEYDGQVTIWGPQNIVDSAADCCALCKSNRAKQEAAGKVGCLVWVFCPEAGGCNGQKQGECWGKNGGGSTGVETAKLLPIVRSSGDSVPWISGAVFTKAESEAIVLAEQAAARAIVERRERPGNPRVFFDVTIVGKGGNAATGDDPAASGGRIEFVLYAHESPRAAENFRAMCTGEKSEKLSFKGMKFYRIIDMFIDQAGSHASGGSIWGGSFDDDPGGLKLKHSRAGLLSAANSGPDTNSGHFSIVVSPAPHLDTGYTIFGEVVSGMDVVMAINKLDKKRPGGSATVEAAGCLANCDPRPEVKPKCEHREETPRPVQGRPIKPCLD